jgi:hypothetical protein
MADQIVESVATYEGKNAHELFFKPVLDNPAWAEMGIKVIQDIQSRLYIFFSSKLDKITKKRNGCGNEYTGDGVSITRRPIDVVDMNAMLKQCADEFNQTIYETAKKKGVEINDLTGTEIEKILIQILEPTIYRDLLRQTWFSDTASGDDDYNAYDGLFKLITAGVAGSTIVNNAIAAMTTPAHAYTALNTVWKAQPRVMKKTPKANKVFLVDRAIFDFYSDYLSTIGNDEQSHTNLVTGLDELKFKGVTVIAMDIWDEYFEADFDGELGNGRIVLAVKEEALIVGADAEGDYTKIQVWYDIDDDVTKFRARYKTGPTLKYHEMLSVAGFESASS